MCYGFGGFGGLGMVLGIVLHLALAALVVFGLIWLFKKGTTRGLDISNHVDGLDVLKLRYARGELSTEDYQRMKKELE